MNKTKIIALSLLTAGALAMTGCGSSSTTTTTPPDTNVTPPDTNVTPPVVVPDYAKPAAVNAISTQQIFVNGGVLQFSNGTLAVIESATALLTSLITQAGANAIYTLGSDVNCANIGLGQGSGSINAVEGTITNGRTHTITFNECTFDTANTLGASSVSMLPNSCVNIARALDNMNNDGIQELDQKMIDDIQMDGVQCKIDLENNWMFEVDELDDMVMMLAYISGVANELEDKVPGANDLGLLDALNDTVVMTGVIASSVNMTAAPVGNVFDNTFTATNFNMSLFENETTVKKFNVDMNGNLAGNLNVTLTATAAAIALAGANNLSTTASVNSAANVAYFDFGLVGQNSAHTLNIGMVLDPTQVPQDGTNPWENIASASLNDSGDGYVRGYVNDLSNGYEFAISTYNKNFTQERAVVTDPSAIPNTGVARRSTYAINGEFGMDSKGLPLIWNTQGAFTFNTATAATKTKVNNGNVAPIYDYAVQSGLIQIAGDSTIELQFLPDTLANTTDGVQDGSLVLRVGSDLTTLPLNTITWLEVTPQP